MSIVMADRVRETTVTTGVGNFTLAGVVAGGYLSFSAGVGVGNQCYYCCTDGVSFEVGCGTLSAALTLTRDNVFTSTNANALVNFSAGVKDVFVTLPAKIAAGMVNLAFS